MEQDSAPSRLSFRQDKLGNGLDIKKNQFGHTILGSSGIESRTLSANEVSLEGNGKPNAHIDIFNTPALQKFMAENDFRINEPNELDAVEEDLVSLEENIQTQETSRPGTLEEFDSLADTILYPNKNNQRRFLPEQSNEIIRSAPTQYDIPEKSNSQKSLTAKKDNSVKIYVNDGETGTSCSNCSATFSINARFCPLCGESALPVNFCIQCGHKYQGQEKFCSECGQKR